MSVRSLVPWHVKKAYSRPKQRLFKSAGPLSKEKAIAFVVNFEEFPIRKRNVFLLHYRPSIYELVKAIFVFKAFAEGFFIFANDAKCENGSYVNSIYLLFSPTVIPTLNYSSSIAISVNSQLSVKHNL